MLADGTMRSTSSGPNAFAASSASFPHVKRTSPMSRCTNVFVAARAPGMARWLGAVAETAGVAPTHPVPSGVEAVRRRHADGRTYLFLTNHGDAPAEVEAAGVDLLTGAAWTGRLDAGGVAVLREG